MLHVNFPLKLFYFLRRVLENLILNKNIESCFKISMFVLVVLYKLPLS